MAKKPSKSFPANQRSILNFRPDIHFVEPDQIEDDKLPELPKPPTIDQVKTDVVKLIEDYKAISDKADELQKEVNDRAAGLVIKLDPNQDAHILDALQRHFNDPNKTEITYEDYLDCVGEINRSGAERITTVDPNDVIAAASDQYRDAFGSLGMASGLARPELQPHAQTIKPLDMKQFKSGQISTLFEMLKPSIADLIIKKIEEINPF